MSWKNTEGGKKMTAEQEQAACVEAFHTPARAAVARAHPAPLCGVPICKGTPCLPIGT